MTKREWQRLQYALENGECAETHKPLAWAVFDSLGSNPAFFWNEDTAVRYALHTNSVARPLYLHPKGEA